MEPTSTFRWRITMILMINTMLMLLVHVVQPMPLLYNPRLRPYLTIPPPPPAVPASPPPPPPLPSFEDLVRDLNKLVCDHSCSLECCRRFGINETLSVCGGLHGPSHPIPEFVARLLFPYSFCYSKCHKRCSYQLPPNLYQCTAGCAYHYIGTKSTEVTDSDAEKEKMRKHVASCYQKCKKFF